jgi:hypothetical protein
MLIAPQCLDSGGPECLGSAAVIGRLDVKSGGNGGWARRAGVGYGRVERVSRMDTGRGRRARRFTTMFERITESAFDSQRF